MKSRMHAMGETGASTVPAFLTKLWTLVDDSSTDELICWDVVRRLYFSPITFAYQVCRLQHSSQYNSVRCKQQLAKYLTGCYGY